MVAALVGSAAMPVTRPLMAPLPGMGPLSSGVGPREVHEVTLVGNQRASRHSSCGAQGGRRRRGVASGFAREVNLASQVNADMNPVPFRAQGSSPDEPAAATPARPNG